MVLFSLALLPGLGVSITKDMNATTRMADAFIPMRWIVSRSRRLPVTWFRKKGCCAVNCLPLDEAAEAASAASAWSSGVRSSGAGHGMVES